MYETIQCPQCTKTLNGPANRLVKDSCGHQKCRMCLLLDEEKCQQCHNNNNNNNNDSLQTSVIKFEHNHTGVITCNGIVKKPDTPTVIKTDLKTNRKDIKKTRKKPTNTEIKRNYQTIIVPNHITVTTDPVQYKCNICDKQFVTKAHIKYHHYCGGEKKPFQCNICCKDFIIRAHLDMHMLKHTGMKPFKCNTCQKLFSEKSKLNRHNLLHSSFKPFICTDCGKSFRSKESLKIHNLIHRGEKPYLCKICNVGFNNTSNLNKHLVSHSNEKSHMCDQCGKRFKLKFALTVHRRSHLRIRPYQCSICAKSFVNNKDLQRHQLIHLDTKAFTCSICNTGFRRKDNLYRHVKNTHPGKKAEPITSTVKQLITQPITTTATSTNIINNSYKKNSGNNHKLVDNPNAINVITASPVCKIKNDQISVVKSDNRSNTVINGPLKLAFKTSAFRNNYNIHRDFHYEIPSTPSKTYDLAESVNICQKILSSPHSPPPPTTTTTTTEPVPIPAIPAPPSPPTQPSSLPTTTRNIIRKVSETTSHEICKNILSGCPSQPINYETYEHKKRAINIKFKLPANYTNLQPLKPVNNVNIENELKNNNQNTYTELKSVPKIATSVIVNSNLNQPHWKKIYKI